MLAGSSSEMSISGGDEVDIAGVNPYHRLMLHINTFGGLASYDGLLVHQPRSSAPSKLLERSHVRRKFSTSQMVVG